jgi:hypothetical protein
VQDHPTTYTSYHVYGFKPRLVGKPRRMHLAGARDRATAERYAAEYRSSGFLKVTVEETVSTVGHCLRFRVLFDGRKWETFYLKEDLDTIKERMEIDRAIAESN